MQNLMNQVIYSLRINLKHIIYGEIQELTTQVSCLTQQVSTLQNRVHTLESESKKFPTTFQTPVFDSKPVPFHTFFEQLNSLCYYLTNPTP